MQQSISTVTSQGQITIPVHIRKLFNLKPGKKVQFIIKNAIIIKPVDDFLSLKGAVKPKKKYSDKEADKKILEFVKTTWGK